MDWIYYNVSIVGQSFTACKKQTTNGVEIGLCLHEPMFRHKSHLGSPTVEHSLSNNSFSVLLYPNFEDFANDEKTVHEE